MYEGVQTIRIGNTNKGVIPPSPHCQHTPPTKKHIRFTHTSASGSSMSTHTLNTLKQRIQIVHVISETNT